MKESEPKRENAETEIIKKPKNKGLKSPKSDVENFSLDKAQLDSLRLEFQDLSPGDLEKMKTLINECDNSLVSNFKNYFPKKETPGKIPARERFLFTDKKTFERFNEKWLGKLQSGDASYLNKENKGNMRTFLERGDFAAGFVPDIWEKIPQEMQKKLIDAAGGEKQAKKAIKNMAARYIITHELAHLHQDPSLPLWFAESGAYCYTQGTMKKNKWGELNSAQDEAADFYRWLLEKYGDDVHKIYFGQLQDRKKREKIIFRIYQGKKENIVSRLSRRKGIVP